MSHKLESTCLMEGLYAIAEAYWCACLDGRVKLNYNDV